MAKPTNREEFKQYCLRKLGAPVIEINLSDEQIEDRIDEAVHFWRDYHFDGSELTYLKHELTQQEIDQGYINIDPDLLGVVRIFELNSSIGTGTGMFNVTYQYVLNNMNDIIGGYDMTNYYMSMSHLQLIQEILVGKPRIRYNRHNNRLYLDSHRKTMNPGMFIIAECYMPTGEDTDMWEDRWLQNYCVALIKENWGAVLTKFTSMQLVGGVMFNGEQIKQEGTEERKMLEEQMIQSMQPLTYTFIG